MKLAFNVLLSLIIKSKIKGHGVLRNSKLCVRLIEIINDCEKSDSEKEILDKFGYKLSKSDSYDHVDKLLNKFRSNGKNYPYELIFLNGIENSVNTPEYCFYLKKMSKLCDEVIDKAKYETLIFTLLEILRHDDSITDIMYGNRYIPREQLFGSYAHPKKICIEALLLGLLYHTHKYPAFEKDCELLPIPDRLKFHLVRYNNEDTLNTDIELNLKDVISENAMRLYAVEEVNKSLNREVYPVQIRQGDKYIINLPDNKNVFIYGSGGMGKTTYLFDMIKNNRSERVCFYFPLYKYHTVFLQKIRAGSCYFLTHILLKYLYQYEYQTIESCSACESEDTVIRQLLEINAILKNNPGDWKPKYVLLLDGINELLPELQDALANEIGYIKNEWDNVRFIITGRTLPAYEVFSDFEKIEMCGISEQTLENILPDYEHIKSHERLTELLKNPLFLNMYIENSDKETSVNTCGEMIDLYIENYKFNTVYDEKLIHFMVGYVLPFAAKAMTERYSYEIDRGELSSAIDKAFEFYISTERVYRNFTEPKGIRKNALLESRDKYDLVDILIENVCFLTASGFEPHKLHFTHQYFRDYFAAKHIINMITALESAYDKYYIDEKEEMFNKYKLQFIWFGEDDFEIYRLIGEIAGDYVNIPCDDFFYTKTILDKALDMARQFDTVRIADNVIKVMSAVRGNTLCDVDFSEISPLFQFPIDIKFSLNGKYPCNFNNCLIYHAGVYSSTIESSARSFDGHYVILVYEDNYVILWDSWDKKIIKEYSFKEYISISLNAVFSSNGKFVTLSSIHATILIESFNGKIHFIDTINDADYTAFSDDGKYWVNYTEYNNRYTLFDLSVPEKIHMNHPIEYYGIFYDNICGLWNEIWYPNHIEYLDIFHENRKYPNIINDDELYEIYQQIAQFKNCDLRDSEFIIDELKEGFKISGAIVD